jgi:hypothetical protein
LDAADGVDHIIGSESCSIVPAHVWPEADSIRALISREFVIGGQIVLQHQVFVETEE